MTDKEVVNLFIKLRQAGWSDTEISDLVIFMETHTPSAKEAEEAKQN